MAKTPAQVRTALLARRDAILDELAAMSATTAGGLPNRTGPGVNIDHQGYRQSLWNELNQLNTQLAKMNPGIVVSEGR